MNHLFPPLLPRDQLQSPVLALAAHPDDEIMGCGGLLAWHSEQGHQVTVAHLTDGAAGDPDARHDDIRAVRVREGAEALRRLGVTDLRSLGFPDGQLPEHLEGACEKVRELLRAIEPRTIYGFFYTEAHRDHRAVAHILTECRDAMREDARVLMYGVNGAVPCATIFDITPYIEKKQHALQAFASQLEYNDFAERSMHRDHAATVNIEDPSIVYAEIFADLKPHELSEARDVTEAMMRFLLRTEG